MHNDKSNKKKGLVIVYTGNGKGKTTAGFGQVLRAVGQGFKVCVIQFIKGKWLTGESIACRELDSVDFQTMGSGFTWLAEDKTALIAEARKAWEVAQEKIMSGEFDLVLLDELTYLVSYEMISESELLVLLAKKPANLHLVITGRDASPGLIQAADLVTEMQEVKHPYQKGIVAQKGIEY